MRNLSIRQSGNGSASYMEQLLRFLRRVRSDKWISGRSHNLSGICGNVVSRRYGGGETRVRVPIAYKPVAMTFRDCDREVHLMRQTGGQQYAQRIRMVTLFQFR